MPPLGRPKPEAAAVDGFIAALETSLDKAASAKPVPAEHRCIV